MATLATQTPKRLTLILLRETRAGVKSILLGMKKRGFGAGKWNGFGGKVEPGETIIQAAAREMEEESGVVVDTLTRRGILSFDMLSDGNQLEIHVFSVDGYSGTIAESEEMAPKWYPEDQIPFKDMWLDDPFWFPMFLNGDTFRGQFVFEAHDNMTSNDVQKTTSADLDAFLPADWARPSE